MRPLPKEPEDKYMTQTPSTDPSPRPSYSVSSQALSSPSSAIQGAPMPSPLVSVVASSSSIPSPVLPEASTVSQSSLRHTGSSSTPSAFSTSTPDGDDGDDDP